MDTNIKINGKIKCAKHYSNIFGTTLQLIIHMKQLIEGQCKNFEENSNSDIIPSIIDAYEQMKGKKEYLDIDPFIHAMKKEFNNDIDFYKFFCMIIRKIDFTYTADLNFHNSKICYTILKDKKNDKDVNSFIFDINLESDKKISKIIKDKYSFKENIYKRPYYLFFHPIIESVQSINIILDDQVFLNPEDYILSIIVVKKTQNMSHNHYILYIFHEKWFQIEDENILPIKSKEDVFNEIIDQKKYKIELFGYCQKPTENIIPIESSEPITFEFYNLGIFESDNSYNFSTSESLSQSSQSSVPSSTQPVTLPTSSPPTTPPATPPTSSTHSPHQTPQPSSQSSSQSSSPTTSPTQSPRQTPQSSSQSSPPATPRSNQTETSSSTTDDESDEPSNQFDESNKNIIKENKKESQFDKINSSSKFNNSSSSDKQANKYCLKNITSIPKNKKAKSSSKKDYYTIAFVDFDFKNFKDKSVTIKSFETSNEKEEYIKSLNEEAQKKSNKLIYSTSTSFGTDYISDDDDKYITIYSSSASEKIVLKKIVHIIFREYHKNLQENDEEKLDTYHAFFTADTPIKTLFEYCSKNIPGNPTELYLKEDGHPSDINDFAKGKKKIAPYGRLKRPKIIYYNK